MEKVIDQPPAPHLSIVVPCYNEAGNVEALYAAIHDVLSQSQPSFEVILVDDGSKDDTLKEMERLRARDERVRCLSLATNYGHQTALMEGLRRSKGSLVVSLDADLQHPPKYIRDLLEEQKRSGAYIVDARRKGLQKSLLKRFCSSTFYRFFTLLCGISLEPGVSDFRLYTRPAVEMLLSIRDPHPFLRGVIPQLRLPRSFIDYELAGRRSGDPGYTFGKSFALGLRALARFSKLPYRLGIFLAGGFLLVAAAQSAIYLYHRFLTGNFIPGNTDIVIILCFGLGITNFLLALLLRQSAISLDILRGYPLVLSRGETSDSGKVAANAR